MDLDAMPCPRQNFGWHQNSLIPALPEIDLLLDSKLRVISTPLNISLGGGSRISQYQQTPDKHGNHFIFHCIPPVHSCYSCTKAYRHRYLSCPTYHRTRPETVGRNGLVPPG